MHIIGIRKYKINKRRGLCKMLLILTQNQVDPLEAWLKQKISFNRRLQVNIMDNEEK